MRACVLVTHTQMGFMVVVFTMFRLPYACMRLCDRERDGVYGGRIHVVHTSICLHAFV